MKQFGVRLSFEPLKNGKLGISSAYGSFLAEAASHCLHYNRHLNPVSLKLTGDVCTSSDFSWDVPNEANERTWADLQEATEYGAYGVAVIVALPLTQAKRVERSAKGTGIDYWLGDVANRRGIFQRAARLEVSGILTGDKAKIAARLKQKLVQTGRSNTSGTPAYVAIVEFGCPEVGFVKASETES